MARRRDTKARIQQAALELFTEQGVRETALWQIADRLGMTKPALYYYFASRDELVASLVTPIIEDMDALLDDWETAPEVSPQRILEQYFDINMRHRAVNLLVVRELSIVTTTDLGTRVVDWRHRLITLLVGADADLPARTRAVIAIGGLADCTVMFTDTDPAELRAAALSAARAALA